MKNLISTIIILLIFINISFAEVGIPLRVKLRDPNGVYPNVTDVDFRVRVLSVSGSCILREEIFEDYDLVNGNTMLILGTGVVGIDDPGFDLIQTFDNVAVKSNLSCVDTDDVIISTNQTYTPQVTDHRMVRVNAVIDGETIIIDFALRSAPYAMNASSVGGIVPTDFLRINSSSSLNQSNLESLLLDVTHFNNLKNIALTGVSSSGVNVDPPLVSSGGGSPTISLPVATNSVSGYLSSADWAMFNGKQNSVGFTPLNPSSNLSDLSSVSSARTNLGLGTAATLNIGTTAGTVASGDDIRFTGSLSSSDYSTDVATANCATTEAPYWDSGATAWACQSIAFPPSAVTIVAGKSGVVSLVAADISGLGSAALLNAGTAANNLVQLDVSSRISAALLPTTTLVSSASFSGDVAGLFNALEVIKIRGTDVSNLIPSLGQVLRFDGVSYSPSSTTLGTVTSVTASSPVISSGGTDPVISMPAATSAVSGYLSSADWTTFNSKQNSFAFTPLSPSNNLSELISVSSARTNLGLGAAATLGVGTSAGTVAAGNDSRINNALPSTTYYSSVSGAVCSNAQAAIWNNLLLAWECQNINFPASAVTSVAGKTGVVSLVAADVSGLGTAAVLNVGTAINNLVQLDGSARIPAVTLPTSAVTTSSSLVGDVTGTSGATVVARLQGTSVSTTAPTAGQALVYNGTSWVPTSGNSLSMVRTTANQIFSTVTLTAVTNMVFNVTSGVTYKYKFLIPFNSAATTTGLRLSLTYPTATLASAVAEIPFAGDGSDSHFLGTINASASDTVVSTAVVATGITYLATVEGVITPSATGTMQLNAASEIAASNITILSGAMYEVIAVP